MRQPAKRFYLVCAHDQFRQSLIKMAIVRWLLRAVALGPLDNHAGDGLKATVHGEVLKSSVYELARKNSEKTTATEQRLPTRVRM